jgi:hypothetical protein
MKNQVSVIKPTWRTTWNNCPLSSRVENIVLTEKAGTVLYWLAWRSHYEPEQRISFEKQVILNIHEQIILNFFKWWNFNDCWMAVTISNLINKIHNYSKEPTTKKSYFPPIISEWLFNYDSLCCRCFGVIRHFRQKLQCVQCCYFKLQSILVY